LIEIAYVLYSRSDLAEMLARWRGVTLYQPAPAPQGVQDVWLGEDILAALRAAPALADRPEGRCSRPANRGNRGGRVDRRGDRPGAMLEAFRQT